MCAKKRFSSPILKLLMESGWFEGRDIGNSMMLPQEFPLFPTAHKVLSEFGNLKIGKTGIGIDRATSDIDMNPMLATGEFDRFMEYEAELGVKLYPLGEVHRKHAFLVIDDIGRIYQLMDYIIFEGENIDAAMENLLLGKWANRNA